MMSSSPLINLTLKNGRAQIKPGQYLDGMFLAYKGACEGAGAWYDAQAKANGCEIEMIPKVLEALRIAGFQTNVAQDLLDALRNKSNRAQRHIDSAKDRIGVVRKELEKRGLSLYPFQESGVVWLASREAGLLADEMGLGKTIQALIALPKDSPVVIITPASLKGNWRNEILKWRPDLTPTILSGRGSWRWPVEGEAVIVNYDVLPDKPEDLSWVMKGELFEAGRTCKGGTVLIADESHAVKNAKAKRTERFKNISKTIRTMGGRVWLLTGTPLLNKPQEIWNVLNTAGLAEMAFGTWWGFVRLFGGVRTEYGFEWGKPSPAAGDVLKTVMLKRDRVTVLPDLPTKTLRTIDVDIDRKTQDLCDAVRQKILNLGHNIGDLLENHQIEFEDVSRVRSALARAKIPALLDLVENYEENGQPVVVFSAHRDPVDTLGKREGWSTITGDTPNEKRSEIVDEFQGGRLKGIAVTIQAGGVGITLTKAHECIFVDLAWTPALNAQAEDRLCRIGQTRGVIVNVLVADHEMDRRVADVLMEKRKLIQGTVEQAVVRE